MRKQSLLLSKGSRAGRQQKRRQGTGASVDIGALPSFVVENHSGQKYSRRTTCPHTTLSTCTACPQAQPHRSTLPTLSTRIACPEAQARAPVSPTTSSFTCLVSLRGTHAYVQREAGGHEQQGRRRAELCPEPWQPSTGKPFWVAQSPAIWGTSAHHSLWGLGRLMPSSSSALPDVAAEARCAMAAAESRVVDMAAVDGGAAAGRSLGGPRRRGGSLIVGSSIPGPAAQQCGIRDEL